nr:RHS repeat-associated core domain-containing protein [Paenacidovorax monticola]
MQFELRYPGQQWDAETNLAYNLHRYYDAQSGRYTQGDPIGLQGGWNRFGYVGGNPLSYVDPMGLQAYMCGAAGLPAWCDKPKNPPTVGVFGCVGLAYLSANVGDTRPSMSLEPTLGGGLEICSPTPPPKPPEKMCEKNNNSTCPPLGFLSQSAMVGYLLGHQSGAIVSFA